MQIKVIHTQYNVFEPSVPHCHFIMLFAFFRLLRAAQCFQIGFSFWTKNNRDRWKENGRRIGKTVQFVFYLAYSKCSTSLMMFMCPFIKCDKVNELVFRMYLWFPLYVTMRSLQSVCFHVFFLLRLFVGFVC